jgi:hypothetical protein
MCGLNGRYNWHDGVDPSEAAFLARPSSLHYLPDGETAVAYIGLYDGDARSIGDVGVYVSDLPRSADTVYRVTVSDGRIVDLEWDSTVVEAWRAARRGDEE